VAFAVTDAGSGIPAELLPHIFDRFVKAADSGGAGLGLAIAKSLVEAHGGEISADSSPGRGTTIRFVCPLPSPGVLNKTLPSRHVTGDVLDPRRLYL
jgi:signal transduction histidine kinase